MIGSGRQKRRIGEKFVLSVFLIAGLVSLGLGARARAAPSHSPASLPQDNWSLSTVDNKDKCSIGLRGANLSHTSQSGNVFAPLQCRRMFPELLNAMRWTQLDANRIDILDRAGAPLLSFTLQDKVYFANGLKGQGYYLAPPGVVAPASSAETGAKFSVETGVKPPPAPSPNASMGAMAGMGGVQNKANDSARQDPPKATPAPPAPAPKVADIPGRYAILRDVARDTGCMLTLEGGARGAGSRALLAPACRDNGISIFEPVSWTVVDGKLLLTARKGHRAAFIFTKDGSWQKDPRDGGVALGFRKMGL